MTTNEQNLIVGKNIKDLREAKGVSLRSLAEELNISYTSLSKVETGEQIIDLDILLIITNYFGVSIKNLVNSQISGKETESYQINEAFHFILHNYLKAKEEPFSEHKMGKHVRDTTTSNIINGLNLNQHHFMVKGSIGNGNWAEIPWVSVFSRSLTTTATRGYYIVFLFNADMSGVYISLNQGWTYFKEKYGAKLGREKIRKTASLIRNKLKSLPNHLLNTEIELGGNGDLSKGYENGHIYGRFYSIESLPENQEIINDLYSMLYAYHEIENLIGSRTVEQFNDFLLLQDDGLYLEDDEQEEQYQNTVNDLANEGYLVDDGEGPKERPHPITNNGGSKRWSRNANTAATALYLSNYKCSFDQHHTTFISKKTGKSFMESHHLVLMNLQSMYKNDLDRLVNIISLCPNCHRAIHHGTDDIKEKILRKLYVDRHEMLKSVGIEITFEQLKKAYGISK
ncbi:MrcB family domain-containing protein [Alkalibacillus sp. S2W]|uniref:MrcB family domain-containing protein n=1 Tax=Alkalibacillus sp. S2W TaxID=3386553 RepID=UPI00398CC845